MYLEELKFSLWADFIERDYLDGEFRAKVFVPAVPAGSTTTTSYPAPPTLVSGAGIWQTIEALTFQNGIPVPESDE